MNLQYLESFYHVAQKKGFSAAADSLDVSKGLVSRHVVSLEKQLKSQLFHRTTRSVTLTEAGQHLYEQAEQLFLLARNAEQQVLDLTQGAQGLVRFTSPTTLGERIIRDILPTYQQQCPNVCVELSFASHTYDIVQGEQDIALRTAGLLPDDAIAKAAGTMRNVLVGSPGYLEKNGVPEAPLDLCSHTCILNSLVAGWNVWKLCSAGQTYELNINGNLSANRHSTARELVLDNHGIANLPYYLVEEDIASGRMQLLLDDYQIPLHHICVVYARQRSMPLKLQIFRDLLLDWFAEHDQYLIKQH
ncbi:MAG: LysR substrate-binding domain-containing protein [Endozoicomonas sp.]